MEDLIGYDLIIENSMRGVVYKVLKKVEKNGLRGDHRFVISFSTKHFGVIISDKLLAQFPSEMTIIIQHQFHSLVIKENNFKISLNFSGIPECLTIPYQAITSFSDPAVNFALKFSASEELSDQEEDITQASEKEALKNNLNTTDKIVSLADFRKNRDKNH
jgi:hypothetical protein